MTLDPALLRAQTTAPAYYSGYTIPEFMTFALAELEAEYTYRSVALPDRRYWTVGAPVYDCNQAVLYVTNYTLGFPGAPSQMQHCDTSRTLSFSIDILRCINVGDRYGNAPSAATIIEDAIPAAVDMEILMDLARYYDKYATGVTVSVNPLAGEGGLLGVQGVYGVTI